MKIKKVAQTPGVLATVSTSKIDSNKDTYSCNYLNDNAVVVSPTEPSDGKVWLQKGKNLWGGIKSDIVYNGLTTNIKDDKFTMTGTAEWTSWCFDAKGRPFINLKAGTYVFSIKNFTGSFSSPISLNLTHSSGTIVDVAVNSNSIKTYYKEFTLTEDTPIYLDFYINSNNIVFSNVSFNVQVESGISPTSYEPYIPKKIHTKNDNGYEDFYNEEKQLLKSSIIIGTVTLPEITITPGTRTNAYKSVAKGGYKPLGIVGIDGTSDYVSVGKFLINPSNETAYVTIVNSNVNSQTTTITLTVLYIKN